MKNKEDRRAPSPAKDPAPQVDCFENRQTNNAPQFYNPYASWTFDQLHSECKRRGLL